MTITNTTRKAGPFNGDDITVIFAFTYKLFANADVLVVLTDAAGVEAVQVLTTDYSVSLNTDQNVSPGGSITMVAAPAVGELLTLGSAMDETQPAEIRNQGPYLPDVLENMVDRNAVSIQQLLETASRTLKIPISDDASRVVELPTETLRADKVLGFDANGDVVMNDALSGVSDATETQKGIIEIATFTEAQALSLDDKAITPLKLLGVMNTSPRRNLVVNGNPLINQRGYVSGTATTGANEYTLDRWRVVTSGQNLTFSIATNAVTLTLPVGGIEQIIEGLDTQSGVYAVSFVATGDTVCNVNGNPRLNGDSFSLTGGVNIIIKFSSASGTGTVKFIQIEKGSVATTFMQRDYGTDLMLCKRYYERINWDSIVSQSIGTGTIFGTGEFLTFIQFTEKRIAGSVVISAHTSFLVLEGSTNRAVSGVTVSSITTKQLRLAFAIAASTNGSAGFFRRNASDDCFIEILAET